MIANLQRPDHDSATCAACETHETRYVISLSVIVTLTGAPTCHTPASLLENAMSWLETCAEHDDAAHVIDRVTVDAVTADEWHTEARPEEDAALDADALAFAAHQAADPHCTCHDCMADFTAKMGDQ
jgi:hypothetical protein